MGRYTIHILLVLCVCLQFITPAYAEHTDNENKEQQSSDKPQENQAQANEAKAAIDTKDSAQIKNYFETKVDPAKLTQIKDLLSKTEEGKLSEEKLKQLNELLGGDVVNQENLESVIEALKEKKEETKLAEKKEEDKTDNTSKPQAKTSSAITRDYNVPLPPFSEKANGGTSAQPTHKKSSEQVATEVQTELNDKLASQGIYPPSDKATVTEQKNYFTRAAQTAKNMRDETLFGAKSSATIPSRNSNLGSPLIPASEETAARALAFNNLSQEMSNKLKTITDKAQKELSESLSTPISQSDALGLNETQRKALGVENLPSLTPPSTDASDTEKIDYLKRANAALANTLNNSGPIAGALASLSKYEQDTIKQRMQSHISSYEEELAKNFNSFSDEERNAFLSAVPAERKLFYAEKSRNDYLALAEQRNWARKAAADAIPVNVAEQKVAEAEQRLAAAKQAKADYEANKGEESFLDFWIHPGRYDRTVNENRDRLNSETRAAETLLKQAKSILTQAKAKTKEEWNAEAQRLAEKTNEQAFLTEKVQRQVYPQAQASVNMNAIIAHGDKPTRETLEMIQGVNVLDAAQIAKAKLQEEIQTRNTAEAQLLISQSPELQQAYQQMVDAYKTEMLSKFNDKQKAVFNQMDHLPILIRDDQGNYELGVRSEMKPEQAVALATQITAANLHIESASDDVPRGAIRSNALPLAVNGDLQMAIKVGLQEAGLDGKAPNELITRSRRNDSVTATGDETKLITLAYSLASAPLRGLMYKVVDNSIKGAAGGLAFGAAREGTMWIDHKLDGKSYTFNKENVKAAMEGGALIANAAAVAPKIVIPLLAGVGLNSAVNEFRNGNEVTAAFDGILSVYTAYQISKPQSTALAKTGETQPSTGGSSKVEAIKNHILKNTNENERANAIAAFAKTPEGKSPKGLAFLAEIAAQKPTAAPPVTPVQAPAPGTPNVAVPANGVGTALAVVKSPTIPTAPATPSVPASSTTAAATAPAATSPNNTLVNSATQTITSAVESAKTFLGFGSEQAPAKPATETAATSAPKKFDPVKDSVFAKPDFNPKTAPALTSEQIAQRVEFLNAEIAKHEASRAANKASGKEDKNHMASDKKLELETLKAAQAAAEKYPGQIEVIASNDSFAAVGSKHNGESDLMVRIQTPSGPKIVNVEVKNTAQFERDQIQKYLQHPMTNPNGDAVVVGLSPKYYTVENKKLTASANTSNAPPEAQAKSVIPIEATFQSQRVKAKEMGLETVVVSPSHLKTYLEAQVVQQAPNALPANATERAAVQAKILPKEVNENPAVQNAIAKAHEVGAGQKGLDGTPVRHGNYTGQMLQEKFNTLKEAFDKTGIPDAISSLFAKRLIKEGVVGEPTSPIASIDKYDERLTHGKFDEAANLKNFSKALFDHIKETGDATPEAIQKFVDEYMPHWPDHGSAHGRAIATTMVKTATQLQKNGLLKNFSPEEFGALIELSSTVGLAHDAGNAFAMGEAFRKAHDLVPSKLFFGADMPSLKAEGQNYRSVVSDIVKDQNNPLTSLVRKVANDPEIAKKYSGNETARMETILSEMISAAGLSHGNLPGNPELGLSNLSDRVPSYLQQVQAPHPGEVGKTDISSRYQGKPEENFMAWAKADAPKESAVGRLKEIFSTTEGLLNYSDANRPRGETELTAAGQTQSVLSIGADGKPKVHAILTEPTTGEKVVIEVSPRQAGSLNVNTMTVQAPDAHGNPVFQMEVINNNNALAKQTGRVIGETFAYTERAFRDTFDGKAPKFEVAYRGKPEQNPEFHANLKTEISDNMAKVLIKNGQIPEQVLKTSGYSKDQPIPQQVRDYVESNYYKFKYIEAPPPRPTTPNELVRAELAKQNPLSQQDIAELAAKTGKPVAMFAGAGHVELPAGTVLFNKGDAKGDVFLIKGGSINGIPEGNNGKLPFTQAGSPENPTWYGGASRLSGLADPGRNTKGVVGPDGVSLIVIPKETAAKTFSPETVATPPERLVARLQKVEANAQARNAKVLQDAIAQSQPQEAPVKADSVENTFAERFYKVSQEVQNFQRSSSESEVTASQRLQALMQKAEEVHADYTNQINNRIKRQQAETQPTRSDISAMVDHYAKSVVDEARINEIKKVRSVAQEKMDRLENEVRAREKELRDFDRTLKSRLSNAYEDEIPSIEKQILDNQKRLEATSAKLAPKRKEGESLLEYTIRLTQTRENGTDYFPTIQAPSTQPHNYQQRDLNTLEGVKTSDTPTLDSILNLRGEVR